MTQIKDVIHLYLGVEIDFGDWFPDYKGKCLAILLYRDIDRNICGIGFYFPSRDNCYKSELRELPMRDLKPILRKLEDMTFEENRERESLWLNMPLNSREDAMRIDATKTKFLLSKGFDLFNLIESGQAIDAKTIEL